MKNILVAYTTNSGSTLEIASAIAEELQKNQVEVDLKRIEEVSELLNYDAVVIGAPMIMGWHKTAVNFIKKNQAVLSTKSVAYFLAAMSLTELPESNSDPIPVFLDPNLAVPPRNPQRLSYKERFATVSNYLKPVLKAAPGVKPVSVAFFGGKLELFRLKWWAMLFVMVIIQASPRDLRNFTFIREWAAGLYPSLIKN